MWITFGVALAISAAAYFVMLLYVQAVRRESGRPAQVTRPAPGGEKGAPRSRSTTIGSVEIQTESPDGARRPGPPQSVTFHHANTAFRRSACFYALGGSVVAATTTGLLFLFGIYSVPSTPSRLTLLACYGGVFWSWSFFTVVALALFCGPDRRLRGLLFFAYLGMLPAMGVLLELAGAPRLPFVNVGLMPKDEATLTLWFASYITNQPVTADSVTFSPHLQPILFWGLSTAPIVVPFLAFNKFIRGTVGPLFINLVLMTLLLTFFINDLVVYTSPGIWFVIRMKRVCGGATFQILTVISFALSALVVWFWLLWITRRYRHMKLSDQTFLFDALWLSVSICLSVYLFGADKEFVYLLGLLPFLLYKLTVGLGLNPLARRAEPIPKAHLLFLRVFGSSSRSERLFDLLAARWRYAGCIHLISAMDVARARFEPDEFIDFLSGRLGNAYINSDADLDRRLAALRLRPDPDGRYRVNEFFCRSDTWQKTVTRLMAQSDLVVMDLRGLTSERRGSIFELGILIDELPLNRVVLLTDKTTDDLLLRQTLSDLWRNMSARSPNADGGIGRVRMIDLACGYSFAVRRLFQISDRLLLTDKQSKAPN